MGTARSSFREKNRLILRDHEEGNLDISEEALDVLGVQEGNILSLHSGATMVGMKG